MGFKPRKKKTVKPVKLDIPEILAKHEKWVRDEKGGERANLTGANLARADLTDASLVGANLVGANLVDAKLTDANLTDANLTGANLTGANLAYAGLAGANLAGANLYGANLVGAILVGADLAGATLKGTCLDPEAQLPETDLSGLEEKDGWYYGYRTRRSQHCGNTVYEPGKSYTAPYFSVSTETTCHPGIYLAPLAWLKEKYPDEPLVRVRAKHVLKAGDKYRAKYIEVLELAHI